MTGKASLEAIGTKANLSRLWSRRRKEERSRWVSIALQTPSYRDRADMVHTAGKYFFESMPKHAPGTPVVVSPMYDSKGKYIGVVAQLLYDATIKHGLDDILYRDDPRPNSSDDKEGEALSPGSRQDQHNQFLDKTEQDQEAVLNKIRREKDKEGKEKPQNVSSASRAVAEHGQHHAPGDAHVSANNVQVMWI